MNTPLLVASLSLPARVNKTYGIAIDTQGRAYRYVKPDAKSYVKWAHLVLAAQHTPQPWRVWQDGAAIAAARARKNKERALRITAWFYFPTVHSDIDGPLKCLLDTLKSYLAIDDRYVYDVELKKFVDRFERVEFCVESCERAPFVSLFDAVFEPPSPFTFYSAETRVDLPRIAG